MKRIIVDYAKLTDEILSLLVEKFPEGYEDSDVIRFRNAQNELIEAVEVRTDDTIYLVKISKKLATRIENFEEDDLMEELDVIAPDKKLDLEEDIDEVEVEVEEEEDDDMSSEQEDDEDENGEDPVDFDDDEDE